MKQSGIKLIQGGETRKASIMTVHAWARAGQESELIVAQVHLSVWTDMKITHQLSSRNPWRTAQMIIFPLSSLRVDITPFY